MDKVVHLADFREKTLENPQVWQCGCGSQEWFLSSAGECVCVGCRCQSTVIRIEKADQDHCRWPDGPCHKRSTTPASPPSAGEQPK